MTPAIPADLQILQHALGIDCYGRGRRYRCTFVTGEGSTDHPACMDLVQRGLMTRRAGNALSGGDDVFVVTEAGNAYVTEHSPAPPKLTRSQRRYERWLQADCGLTFGEWLHDGGGQHA